MTRQNDLVLTNAHYTFCTLNHFLDTAAELQPVQLDLYASPPHLWIDHHKSEEMASLRDRLDQRGLRVRAVTPEQHSGRYVLSTPDPSRWERSKAFFTHCMAAASGLGAELFCLYPGGILRSQGHKETLRLTADRLLQLAELAGQQGLRVAIGPACPGQYAGISSLDLFSRLMSASNHPNLFVTLDTLAAAGNGESLSQWFAVFPNRIAYVRLCDGRPGGGRAVWGTGVYPLDKTLAELDACGYGGPLALSFETPPYMTDPAEPERQNFGVVRAAMGGEGQ